MKTFLIGLATLIGLYSILYGVGYGMNLMFDLPKDLHKNLGFPFIGLMALIGVGGVGGIILAAGIFVEDMLNRRKS